MWGKNGQALFPSTGGCLISFLRQNVGHLSLGKLDRLSMAMIWAIVFSRNYRLLSSKNGSTNYVLSCVRNSGYAVEFCSPSVSKTDSTVTAFTENIKILQNLIRIRFKRKLNFITVSLFCSWKNW